MPEQRVIVGNVMDVLRDLPASSVHCCVTSPPYFGLRDYGLPKTEWPDGWVGCLGAEPTVALFVAHLVEVFGEVWRVLRDDGTCWLNIGDSYTSGNSGQTLGNHSGDIRNRVGEGQKAPTATRKRRKVDGAKPKDLCLVPQRLAIALQDFGWYVRSVIIWSKPSCMPESVTDRPTTAHEYVLLLSKRARYYYDQEAVKEASLTGDFRRPYGSPGLWALDGRPEHQRHGGELRENGDGSTRNLRTVWTLNPEPQPLAHFATFPSELPRRAILAGTSERGVCRACGAPWRRMVERSRSFESGSGRAGNLPAGKNGAGFQGGGETVDIRRGPVVHSQTTGWVKSCRCEGGDAVPATILDPFLGSGTTLVVASQLGRNGIGIELSEHYANDIALPRIEREGSPLFDTTTVEANGRQDAEQTLPLFAGLEGIE